MYFSFTHFYYLLIIYFHYLLIYVLFIVGSEIPKHNGFDLFENLNSISNIFQETQDFLFLTGSVNICMYLRKIQSKFL